jgi:hypothetical protein
MIPDCEDAVPSGGASATNSTLCAIPPVFLHSTVSPALIVSALGMNSAGASLMTTTAAGSWRPPGPDVTGLPVWHPKPATAVAAATAARTRCILGVTPIIVPPPWIDFRISQPEVHALEDRFLDGFTQTGLTENLRAAAAVH